MVACAMSVLREGHHEIELGAVLKLGVDRQRPSDQARPLLDADEAEAAAPTPFFHGEAATIVGDGQPDTRAATGQRHVHALRPRVPDHVAQGLLGHAIEAQCHVSWHGTGAVVGMKDHLWSLLALDLVTMPAQGGDEPGLLEDTRVQIVREVAHAFRDVADLLPQSAELLASPAARLGLPLEHAERDGHRGEVLTDVVVQLAGDPPPFLFLGGHELTGEMADLLCALPRRALRMLPPERAGEDVGEKTKPRDQLARPLLPGTRDADRQRALGRGADDQGHHGEGPHAEVRGRFSVDRPRHPARWRAMNDLAAADRSEGLRRLALPDD